MSTHLLARLLPFGVGSEHRLQEQASTTNSLIGSTPCLGQWLVLEGYGTVLDVQPVQAALAVMTVMQKEVSTNTKTTYKLVQGGRTGSF